MSKYKTVAFPVDLVERYERVSDMPLSLLLRAVLTNFVRMVDEEKKTVDEVFSYYMFGGF